MELVGCGGDRHSVQGRDRVHPLTFGSFETPSPFNTRAAITNKAQCFAKPRAFLAMEPSPLTQVSRPELFQPKIISLYETLFKVSTC